MKYILNDEYEYNFNLIGISCHEKDYRLCWAINQSLKISLEKEDENLEVLSNKTKGMSSHSLYYYKNEDTKNEFYLIKNRSSFGILIPEQSQADYLLMIKENYAFNLNKHIKYPHNYEVFGKLYLALIASARCSRCCLANISSFFIN